MRSRSLRGTALIAVMAASRLNLPLPVFVSVLGLMVSTAGDALAWNRRPGALPVMGVVSGE